MRIGNLDFGDRVPLWLAPLAGYTDRAFRRVCRHYGVDLTVSEMVSADGLVLARRSSKGWRKTLALLDADPVDHPFVAQLFGKDPSRLAEACRIVQAEARPEVIDLNAGCPVRKVVASGHGVALMRDPVSLGRILAAMRAATNGPLTVKLRAGAEVINVVECARVAADAGVDAIIVHPRTRGQMFSGQADWSLISAVRHAVDLPVIGNGDIREGEDAVRMVRETGCHGVMIGRGAVGRPWVFAACRAALTGQGWQPPDHREKYELLKLHLEALTAYKGSARAVREIRKFALQTVRGLRGAAAARQDIANAPDEETLLRVVAGVLLDGDGWQE